MHAKGVISGFSPKELALEIHPGAYCKVTFPLINGHMTMLELQCVV